MPARNFKAAAAFPNLYCKLSGMVTEADWQNWTAADLKPYVHAALDAFGPERLMYGSDWPVCELAATYEEQFAAPDPPPARDAGLGDQHHGPRRDLRGSHAPGVLGRAIGR